MANIQDADAKNFKNLVLESDIPVIVDFWAQWCGPCRKLSPVLEQIQNEYKDQIKVFKVNGDDNAELLKEYGVMGLPTLLFFQKGEIKEVMVGLVPKSAITSNIKKFII